MLEKLIENSSFYLNNLPRVKKRYFYDEIDHNDKLIGIIGARGVGKTTYLLHYLKNLNLPLNKRLYISADSIEVAKNSLIEIAKSFEAIGGEILVIDEIHKYKQFEIELKQIYDMLKLKVIFSGSSAIELEHKKADLSRRAVIYNVNGLSYREFIDFKTDIKLSSYSLEDILSNHMDIAFKIKEQIKPLEFFKEYLQYGYYPFYFDNPKSYKIKLNQTINTVIEVDIPSIFKIKYENISSLKKLITLICSSEPFKLNIKELSAKIGIDRDTLYLYLEYLNRGKIFRIIRPIYRGDSIFVKPDKIYLNNSNLNYSYCVEASIGTIRETFFASMVDNKYSLAIAKVGDFLVNQKYIFEVGGKRKSFNQIKDLENSYVVADNTDIGFGNKIPLWLFGFLY